MSPWVRRLKPFAFAPCSPLSGSTQRLSASNCFTSPLLPPQTRLPCLTRRPRPFPVRATATSPDSSPPSPQPALSPNSTSAHTNPSRRKFSLPGLAFLLITALWSILLILPMAIAHPFVLWRDRATRRFQDFVAMLWMKCTMFSFRMTPAIISAHNLPSPNIPVVYVANHASYLDIYIFAALGRRIKYLSKSEIFKLPIIGWAMTMAGYISVRRMNKAGQMEAYRRMVQVIRNGISLVIFPEGTRSVSGKLRKFQAGAFRAAKQKGVAVVPITILGTREVMPAWAWLPVRYPPERIRMVVHPPIDSTKYSIDELRDMAFEAVDSALPTELQTRPLPKHA